MTSSRIQILKQYLWLAVFVIALRVLFRIIFGELSWLAFQSAFIDGLKLALWVLGFGVLNLLVDFQKLVPRSPKFFRTPITALNISMALTPEIGRSVTRVREASKLRANRRGLRLAGAIAVPVLSNAIDRALKLGDSIESRCFGNTRVGSSVVGLNEVSVTFGEQLVLNRVSFHPALGSITLITGNTGSGKSTLLKILQAANPGSAYVDQFPRDAFVASTVFDELAFALEQQRVDRAELVSRVEDMAAQFSLTPFLKSEPSDLSSGFQQRLAIAAGLISGTKLLLLDEPFSALDRESSEELQKILPELSKRGTTVVVVEHRTDLVRELSNSYMTMTEGVLLPGFLEIVDPVPTPKPSGTVTVLTGSNGSGKTTYLRKLARERGVLVPQPAGDLLFRNTVAEELAQADYDSKKAVGSTAEILKSLIGSLPPEQNPRDLSEGQRMALAIAIQLSQSTDFLMLDEPTLGLDQASRRRLISILSELASNGTELLIATHDERLADWLGTERLEIADGVIKVAR